MNRCEDRKKMLMRQSRGLAQMGFVVRNDLQKDVRLRRLCYVDKARYWGSPPKVMGFCRRGELLEAVMRRAASSLVVNRWQRSVNWTWKKSSRKKRKVMNQGY